MTSLALTAGRRGDSPQFKTVLDGIRVLRLRPGRARTRPNRVPADKAYSSKDNRRLLRRRKIAATVPVKADQAADRRRRGAHGGREYAFDKETEGLEDLEQWSSDGHMPGLRGISG